MSFRQITLAVFKALGGFALARTLTPRGLRVICYHGISFRDEHCFQPKLFIREELFRKRIDHIKSSGYPVLLLDEALALMHEDRLPPRALVITFDDGWLGIGAKAAPLLHQYGFPSTLYVTTRDVVNETPVFDVALRYLLWKGQQKTLDLSAFGSDAGTIALGSSRERERAASLINEVGASWNDDARQALLCDLAESLDVDWKPSNDSPLFRLMTIEQLARLPEQGMDLQLHTHRHCLPITGPEGVEKEITENRVALERIVRRPLQHFCYPSGEFQPVQFPWLRALGIVSATTCLSGFNYPDTERLELRRFLDGENITQLEFEAELSGFLELMRKLRGIIRRGTSE